MAPQPGITHPPPPGNKAKVGRSCPSLVAQRTVEKWAVWDSSFTWVPLCFHNFKGDMWKREIRVEKGKMLLSNRFYGASVRSGGDV